VCNRTESRGLLSYNSSTQPINDGRLESSFMLHPIDERSGRPLRAVKIFVRPEGRHYIALCDYPQLIVEGRTEKEAVDKTKLLATRALSSFGNTEPARLTFLIRAKDVQFETVTLEIAREPEEQKLPA